VAEIMKLDAFDLTMAKVIGERVVGAGRKEMRDGVCVLTAGAAPVSCFSEADVPALVLPPPKFSFLSWQKYREM